MSGFEVARLILGIIPLAISALEHYKTGRSTARTFIKFRGELDTLIYRLKLQKTFFYLHIIELLHNAGVSEVVNNSAISEEECIRILQNGQSASKIQEYLACGHLYDTFQDILSRYETCLKTIVSKLGHIKRPPKAAKDDLKAILEYNPMGTSSFAFRGRVTFTMEKDSLKLLVEELREDRLSLKEMIDNLKLRQGYTVKQPTDDARQLAIILSTVQQQAALLFEAMRKGRECGCENNHKIFMRLDNRVPLKNSRRRSTREQIEFSLIFDLHGHLQDTHIDVHDDDLHRQCDVGENYRSTLVSARKVVQLSCGKAVTHICQHVQKAQKAGHILKLRLNNEDLFLIEGQPENRRDFTAPITLVDILKAGCQDDDARMFPKDQALLALNVASSILQLQQTRWLMTPFNSSDIKLLAYQEKISVFSNSFPFVEQHGDMIPPQTCTKEQDSVIGPDPKTALTELAILLLEIWHHRPIEAWCQKMGKERPASPQGRLMIAIEWLQATSRRLLPYQNQVIEQCLQVCAGSLRFWQEEDFLRLYCENIIKPLQESLGAWETSGTAVN
ncbi:hypothetical protein V8C35DRAFT_313521 [Trichoderma chlorosporum]